MAEKLVMDERFVNEVLSVVEEKTEGTPECKTQQLSLYKKGPKQCILLGTLVTVNQPGRT